MDVVFWIGLGLSLVASVIANIYITQINQFLLRPAQCRAFEPAKMPANCELFVRTVPSECRIASIAPNHAMTGT
jgi:hypothetical protein